MFKNKKGLSEVISFVLIVALITILSTSAYFFAKTNLDEQVAKIDRSNMENYFKKISYKIDSLQNFDSATTSMSITFNKGLLIFEGNKTSYNSIIRYSGSDVCFNNICYESNGGYEKIAYYLTNSYIFSSNITLTPGTYLLIFENNKNETEITIKFQ
jgi:hypothetical protein